MSRCFGDGDPLYERYHDDEWGFMPPLSPDERELLERLSLEAFQAGLSWLTILRKREALRAAFTGFVPQQVASFTEDDVARLLADATIVRNERKIRATITNARALVALHEGGEHLADVLTAHRPEQARNADGTLARAHALQDLPVSTEESASLAKDLKSRGFAFVGPTTTYATLQALGIVDDHLADCTIAAARDAAARHG